MPTDVQPADEAAPPRRRRSNARTAAILFAVALAFYLGMIFVGPLSQ